MELTAPFDPGPGRQFDLGGQACLGLIDVAAQVTANHVRFNVDAALAVVAADLVQALREAELHQLAQWYRTTNLGALRFARRGGICWQHHRQCAQFVEVVA